MEDCTDHLYCKSAVFAPEQRCKYDTHVHSASETVAVSVGCADPASCAGEVNITPSDSLQTSASSVSGRVACNSNSLAPADTATDGSVQPSKGQFTEGCISTQAGPQLASSSASGQESLPGCAHRMTLEAVSAESLSFCSSDSTTVNTATTDVCNSVSSQTSHSHIGSQTPNSVGDKTANNTEETRKTLIETEDFSSPIRDAQHMPSIASTPESQSIKHPVVQSSLHSTRQVKCRKTGHRRITANGANLSLGQLINAVSESCLNENLDSTYVSTSSLTSRSGAEHRMTTPVKAANASDGSVVRGKLARHFDSEADCVSDSPTSESQGSPQVVDGVRRPPKARKSCHSGDKVTSDLPKEPSSSPGGLFGTVHLAELVDSQSMDKLDVRSFDKFLLAKMKERILRPGNGYRLRQTHAAATPASEGVKSRSDAKIQGLDSGTPLIPSAAKTAKPNRDSSTSSTCPKQSSRTDAVQQNVPQVSNSSSTDVHNMPGESSRKRVWRCRKTNSSVGNAQQSAGSRINGAVKHSVETTDDFDVTIETQSTRRSPRCVKHGPSGRHSDEVGKCDMSTCFT